MFGELRLCSVTHVAPIRIAARTNVGPPPAAEHCVTWNCSPKSCRCPICSKKALNSGWSLKFGKFQLMKVKHLICWGGLWHYLLFSCTLVTKHLTDLKTMTFFASRRWFLFIKHADGCSEFSKHQMKWATLTFICVRLAYICDGASLYLYYMYLPWMPHWLTFLLADKPPQNVHSFK